MKKHFDAMEAVYYIVQGHSLPTDVQTIIQVFYPNLHYYQVSEPKPDGITIASVLERNGVTAIYYENGNEMSRFFMEPNHLMSELITVKEMKRLIKGSIYFLCRQLTGIHPRWGFVTGVRPAKTMTELLEKGYAEQECLDYFVKGYDVSPSKARLSLDVARAERKILSDVSADDISVYIGIPFCPTRCLYCSFTSYTTANNQTKVEEYLEALFKELKFVADYANQFSLKSLYIGGGTPTALTEAQLERLLEQVALLFPLARNLEYTVEAGRPDTISVQKLRLLKQFGVNRISINPQTMNDSTLRAIGRKHTVEDVKRVFALAREQGHENINMDLILGLPGEGEKEVQFTFKEVKNLLPDNLTVHTLAVKRASKLKESFDLSALTSALEMEKMLAVSAEGAQQMGMKPYYMYRQKNMVGNFENVGYCQAGKEGYYNVQIMEEKQTILAAGAGASTKVVFPYENRIERIFNVKSLDDYIGRIDEMIDRKRKGLYTKI